MEQQCCAERWNLLKYVKIVIDPVAEVATVYI